MFILLPPSEGKARVVSDTATTETPRLDLADLLFPGLSGERHTVIQYLQSASAMPGAHEILKVGKSLSAEIDANQQIMSSPVAPGHKVYTGVLFDALDYHHLGTEAQVRADERVLVFSALFGATRLGDPIPFYRMSAASRIDPIGNPASWWRKRLDPELDTLVVDQPIIDCRSGAYASFWKPPAEQTATVDVFQIKDGVPKVVSHFAKHTRGLVAHILLSQPEVSGLEQACEVIRQHRLGAGWDVELVETPGSKPYSLRITLPEV